MGDGVDGREAVGVRIDALERRYGSLSIDQTTVTVPADGYERARRRASDGLIDAYVRIWNDEDEALHLRCDRNFAIGDDGAGLEAAVQTAVTESAGVDATITDVERVTIAGIRNEDEPEGEALYRLFVLFDATHAGGSPDGIEWTEETPATPEIV